MSGWSVYIATIDYRFPLTAFADTAPRGCLILAWYAALRDRRLSTLLTVSSLRQRADGAAIFFARPRKKPSVFRAFLTKENKT